LPGGQVALSSRSGSNEWHGALAYTLRNEALDANDWFANQHGDSRTPLRLGDLGSTLGGPLQRNRAFFFVSYERVRLEQPFVWRQPTPTRSIREQAADWARPIVDLFPQPNGPPLGGGLAEWTGRVSRPSQLDTGAARLDYSISSKLTAFGRFSETPSATEFGSSAVNLLDLRSTSLTAGLNLMARPDLAFDLRLNGSSAR